MTEIIDGGCHCGNLNLKFYAASLFSELPVRACQCNFCRKHNVRATADPDGRLEIQITDASKVSKYRFGLGITDFLVCKECGTYVAAVMEDPDTGKLLATCVVNTLEIQDSEIKPPVAARYDDETSVTRLERRRKRWMQVVIT
ncbi:MAG: aldehyde-activating protein [Rhodospirillaceae bacterium]|nr:aldehyde-activating protein [Rhodospirillaceae bacterium]